jgi:hypothetical protein
MVPHEFYECGDPEWCLHDIPSDGPAFELIPIALAGKPGVFGDDSLALSSEDLPGKLLKFGLPEHYANGLAIVFHEKFAESVKDAAGYFNSAGYRSLNSDGSDLYYPLAVHVLSGMPLRTTNHVIRHEIWHGVEFVKNEFEKTPVRYHQEKYKDLARRLGGVVCGLAATIEAAAATLGHPWWFAVPTGALALTGAGAVKLPEEALWMIEPEERRCEKFARSNKDIVIVKQRES